MTYDLNDPKTFINNLINNLSIICVNIIMYNYKN